MRTKVRTIAVMFNDISKNGLIYILLVKQKVQIPLISRVHGPNTVNY